MKSLFLEYREILGENEFTALYHYKNIELEQILARRECEFFVKEGVTYKQDSSAIEEDKHIIYVKKYNEEPKEKEDISAKDSIKLEIRELKSVNFHPVLESKYFTNHLDVLSYIGTIYIYLNGIEWERDSAEIDEDRLCYVLYVTKTGYQMEGG
ncbi:MAG TPA: hypothetical protein VNM69_12770 [Bacillus sp. (in: firmicutes)]|uniref:hypothetical protein n=1 Tax=Bacillus litorisediminis TaxID=2922713 RepID=UPI001FAE4C13|nr:hypothetical protein [Bacillus litorisediminis]HWO76755.1 hypothetical protein [Bacillus sp. (in: firmicutes)]